MELLKGISSFIKHILVLIPLVALVAAYFYHRFQVKKYREKLVPEIDCYYKYITSNEEYKFFIRNVGTVDVDSLWVEENIFLIIDDEVYEGCGVPHFNYLVYNNSRDKMWDLETGKELEITLPDLQIKAFYDLRDNYKSKVISKWKITFSTKNSYKKHYFERHFIFDFQERLFLELDDFHRKNFVKNKLKEYSFSSSKNIIDINDITGSFEINPPQGFLINPDYSFVGLYPSTKLTIEDFNKSILFTQRISDIQLADDLKGSVSYVWAFKNGKWAKQTRLGPGAAAYLKPVGLPLVYLSKREADMVEANPSLLKYYREDREVPTETPEQILTKVYNKYLAETTNQ